MDNKEYEYLVEAIQLALNRFEKDHANEYMERRNEGEYFALVLEGMYFTIESIKNSIDCYYGTEKMSKELGFKKLANTIEKAVFGKHE